MGVRMKVGKNYYADFTPYTLFLKKRNIKTNSSRWYTLFCNRAQKLCTNVLYFKTEQPPSEEFIKSLNKSSKPVWDQGGLKFHVFDLTSWSRQ